MYGNGQAPIFILKDGTQRTRGRTAQSNNIAAAKAVADAVRSTLGPKGMDKMLVDSMGDVVITNDGATILKEMDIEHPAAKMIIEVAKTQEQHCFDGTTTAVVLSGELLKRSEDLIEQNVHPTVICEGFRLAAEKAVELLESHGIATMNDEGFLKIVDRKKDMIISSGYNVYPNELEDYLATHPDILEAGVIGVDDKNRGEYIKAFVVSKNEHLSSSDIIAFCKNGLTEYKVPKRIVFIKELPKTNVGKILRRELRKLN